MYNVKFESIYHLSYMICYCCPTSRHSGTEEHELQLESGVRITSLECENTVPGEAFSVCITHFITFIQTATECLIVSVSTLRKVPELYMQSHRGDVSNFSYDWILAKQRKE